MTAPSGLAEIQAAYGHIRIEADKLRGGYRIYDPIGWETANMVLLRDLPGMVGRNLFVHRKIVKPLTDALTQWRKTCPEYAVISIGCFNPRYKRTTKGEISLHTWGVAVDINAHANPLVTLKNQNDPFKYDMPNAFIAAFRDNGWTWGGDFKGLTKDPMHYQYASNY